jgi:hypothetical protein
MALQNLTVQAKLRAGLGYSGNMLVSSGTIKKPTPDGSRRTDQLKTKLDFAKV